MCKKLLKEATVKTYDYSEKVSTSVKVSFQKSINKKNFKYKYTINNYIYIYKNTIKYLFIYINKYINTFSINLYKYMIICIYK